VGTRRAALGAVVCVASWAMACGAPIRGASGPAVGVDGAPSGSASSATRKPAAADAATASTDRGKPLQFALDPVERGSDPPPFALQLRGARALVFMVASFDYGSLIQLRKVTPLLRALPSDARCLIVARQPLSSRPLIAGFLASLELPCDGAIADPERDRLGDLAIVGVVPSTLVLRADGTLAAAFASIVEEPVLRGALEAAR
jgi:hypothetical protein